MLDPILNQQHATSLNIVCPALFAQVDVRRCEKQVVIVSATRIIVSHASPDSHNSFQPQCPSQKRWPILFGSAACALLDNAFSSFKGLKASWQSCSDLFIKEMNRIRKHVMFRLYFVHCFGLCHNLC